MAREDFATLKHEFTGDLVTPTDSDYKAALARWAITAERNAKIVAFVKSNSDVVLAINYAKAHKLPVAIRGGGHSPYGASSSEGGLVIDLSRYMNEAKIDPVKRLAYVGGGAVWKVVDDEAIKHGLATVAGTVNHTGVGGLLLAGGFGWLSGSHGLIIDNLVEATVVVANGSILKASDTENPDLFFAIRGGGSNFGVVTEFVLKLHSQRRKIYAGFITFHGSMLDKLVDVTNKWWETIQEKEGMCQFITLSPDGTPLVLLLVFYNGSEAEGRAAYKAFFDLGPISDTTGEVPYEELNALTYDFVNPGQCVYFKGVAQRVTDHKSLDEAVDKFTELSSTNNFSGTLILEFLPLDKINSVPQGVTAFRRAGNTPNVLCCIYWKVNTPENNEIARKHTYEIVDILSRGQSNLTELEKSGYTNYDPVAVEGATEARQERAKFVFSENYPRLQKIKRKYDPDVIFNKWFPIVPA